MRFISASSSWAGSANTSADAVRRLPVDLHQSTQGMRHQVRHRIAKNAPSRSAEAPASAAGQCEQAPDKVAALLRRPLGHAEDLGLLVVQLDALLQQPEAPEHGRQQIVEVVRDAAGELADRVHLLGLKQLAFERALFRCRPLDFLRLRKQVDEYRHLRPQDDRIDRFEDVVDRAHCIAAQQVFGLLVDRRQKDDRDALGLVARADDLGGLVAVHPRHVDVEQDDRELALQQVPKRLLTRTRHDDLTKILKHGRNCQQIALVIIDEEYAWTSFAALARRYPRPRACRQRLMLRGGSCLTPPPPVVLPSNPREIEQSRLVGGRAAIRCRRAWRCSPMHPHPGTSGGRPSSLSR